MVIITHPTRPTHPPQAPSRALSPTPTRAHSLEPTLSVPRWLISLGGHICGLREIRRCASCFQAINQWGTVSHLGPKTY